jgi:FAD:protein FMN transferase
LRGAPSIAALLVAVLAVAGLALAGCAARPAQRETLLSGETMGSTWTVKVAGAERGSEAELRDGIQAQFDAVNLALSTWRGDSALSRFNARDDGEWVDVDPELAAVMRYALSLAAASDGAYDVTVGPLVNLWGFGPDPATGRVPEDAAIRAARERVGWRKVEVDATRARARKEPGVRVDLSSLGKGRGVDRVAEYLDARGVTDYLIDLSGKLRARGRNAQRAFWRVAVERPGPDQPVTGGEIGQSIVTLRDDSIATAGDYRRFFESGGRHYSHIIDPATGAPVTHRTVSATALAADCMQADALATIFMVMPPAAALRLADERGVPALLIVRDGDAMRVQPSTRWRAP